ncbi:hypothetical protein [Roseibium sp. RKSG952]|uniref:hypothetical protein n=1 Tax=Roseibium sp. RKSG952 TaxID=2529384 RepID=UPI0012BBD3F0|nr:hypothetical protein [Roseibium sp. RKSG952]MTH95982.1 hypothetical protein [Roseibium sp. RKSG952]
MRESIINLDMKGLVSPEEIHEVGEETDGERPGEVLIAEVRSFASDGGFTRLREEAEMAETHEQEKEAEARQESAKRKLATISNFAARIGEEKKNDTTSEDRSGY